MLELSKQTIPQDTSSKSKVSSKDIQVSTDGFIYAKQLKDLIMGAIAKQDTSGSKTFWSYIEPYTRRIELLKMPENYQPPKFNNAMVKVTQSNMLRTSLRRVATLELKESCWSSNLCIP
ncbi:hypothetical protein ACSBR1_025796 [Camellia fascicularis]